MMGQFGSRMPVRVLVLRFFSGVLKNVILPSSAHRAKFLVRPSGVECLHVHKMVSPGLAKLPHSCLAEHPVSVSLASSSHSEFVTRIMVHATEKQKKN